MHVLQLLARLRGLFRARELDARLDEELAFHLDKLTEQNIRNGMAARAARTAARRALGRIDPVKETYRNQRGIPMLEIFMRDARVGLRSLIRSPVFTLTALSSLVLGIGANTAIFSVVNAALLRPLPYPDAHRIVEVVRQYPTSRGTIGYSRMDRQRFMAVQENATSFSSVSVTGSSTGLNIVNGETAEYITGKPVSHEYFHVLGVTPDVGRTFLPEEDVAGGPDVVVISHEIWSRILNADPEPLGRIVTLSGAPHSVVGVMPRDFRSIPDTDVWIPLRPATNGQGNGFNYSVLARLAPRVELPQVNAELKAIAEGVRASNPGGLSDDETFGAELYSSVLAGDVRPALLILMAAVGVVLLIACANVANLLLARSMNRGREMAMRVALGASRGRLIRQLLTESLILAAVAGVFGLLLAWRAAPMLMNLSPASASWREVRLDPVVIAVTVGATLMTGLLFGLIPAIVASRSVSNSLREDGIRTTVGARANWIRQAFVVVEVASSLILLVAAALFVRSFINLRSVDLGFEPANLLTAQMSLSDERFRDPETVRSFYRVGIGRLRALPGVQNVAVVSGLPVERGLNLAVRIPNDADLSTVAFRSVDYRYVSDQYFDVMSIPVVSGRSFDEQDRFSSDKVAIVNEEFVGRYLAEGNPIGTELVLGGGSTNRRRIVGVVKDVQEQGIGSRGVAVVYVLVDQADRQSISSSHYYYPISWVVKTLSDPRVLSDQVRNTLRDVDQRVPVSRVQTMDDVVSNALDPQRFQTVLFSVFSAVAILLAVAGIYGLMTYTVSSNIREIGIRMALGATGARVVGSITAKGVAIAMCGATLGVAGALVFARSLESFVFGITATDPITLVSVTLALLLVAAVASALPALRAVRKDPVRTLRTD